MQLIKPKSQFICLGLRPLASYQAHGTLKTQELFKPKTRQIVIDWLLFAKVNNLEGLR